MGVVGLTQRAVKTLCDDSIGCSEVDNLFATETDTMIDAVYKDGLGEE